jgi:hypothetical protein
VPALAEEPNAGVASVSILKDGPLNGVAWPDPRSTGQTRPRRQTILACVLAAPGLGYKSAGSRSGTEAPLK